MRREPPTPEIGSSSVSKVHSFFFKTLIHYDILLDENDGIDLSLHRTDTLSVVVYYQRLSFV